MGAAEFRIGEMELKIPQLQKDLQRKFAAELSEMQAKSFELNKKMVAA